MDACEASDTKIGGCEFGLGFCLGRSLPYEVQNHVHLNFATPMLYAKNHLKFHNFFCGAINPLELYFVNF